VKNDYGESPGVEVYDIDECAKKALTNETEFELLLQRFRPFLSARASRLAGTYADRRDEMMDAAGSAFFEAVKEYDKQKGHFFQFMNTVVHRRLTDVLRGFYAKRVDTVPIENDSGDRARAASPVDIASMNAYMENERRYGLNLEIECFKGELAEWGVTLEELEANSPKQERLRGIYKRIAADIINDAEITQIIFARHYFPVKKISVLSKVPRKTVERARIYLLASVIIWAGDYDYLKGYISNGMENDKGSGKGGRL